MNAVVVYESIFGNTRTVAEAIAGALSRSHHAVAVDAANVDTAAIATCDLLVIGAPTHGHGLPKPESRLAGGRSAAAGPFTATSGVRELLARLPAGDGRQAAAFDTALRGPRWLWGAASRSIGSSLREHGYSLLAPPQTFVVRGMRVPSLPARELEHARRWGAQLGAAAPVPAGRRRVA